MKIELLSENKIQIELTSTDLKERNIQLRELAIGSEKAYSLLREIMETAYYKYNFNIDESPIVIETTQLATNMIKIIITRISDEEDVNEFVPSGKNMEDLLKNKLDLFKKLGDEAKNSASQQNRQKTKESIKNLESNLVIFSFVDMDTVAKASVPIEKYNFKSILYKRDDKFFLVLEKGTDEDYENARILLNEFGDEHMGNDMSKLFLNEHSKIIIKKDAVQVLSNFLV